MLSNTKSNYILVIKMENMKTTNEILNEIFKERNSSPKTQKLYRQSVAQFEIFSNKKLEEILLALESTTNYELDGDKKVILSDKNGKSLLELSFVSDKYMKDR